MRKALIPKETLEDLYVKQGLTTYEIAKKLVFCQGTIWNWLVRHKIKRRLSYTPVSFTRTQLKKWYLEQKLSTRKIESITGHSRGVIHVKLREWGIGTRNIAVSHIKHLRHDFTGDIYEEAYLIGFRIGDLNVTKRTNGETIAIKCASTKAGQITLFKNLFSKYGHILEGKPTKEGKVNIQANLNLSFSFLLSKKPENYNWVFKDKNIFFAFLSGFSDAEGSFFISQGKGFFSIGNYDKHLLVKLRKHLIKFGIEVPNISTYKKELRKFYNGYKSKGNYYILSCSRKIFLLKLIDNMKPFIRHPDKIASSLKIEDNIKQRNNRYGNLRMVDRL
ncbi:MAG: hypothetical protein A2941_00025 [Candidatus Yanofskybacteria bacterium RIFCSPLOWO2_01_FULL_49_17]|uniref:Homing endonuclease LAGLIDADG domain-containing protein n=1 Tax=Candidatus Yanofskybacteria bacterium RIFCSPLOWO2_01_FULL_49_17 TaxID=1802700 RepID=A0A1F8GTZ1_9BACT|nr:MAG: hypothetical protein A2941_00025 [Candidatus Yanofskybacteria bacterium RIFCSPLOWO2_01_FULL_49_17]